MKLSLLHNQANRRRHQEYSGRVASPEESLLRSPSPVIWILLHGVCCVISLVLGFRFSRLAFFLLLYSPSSSTTTTTASIFNSVSATAMTTTTTTTTTTTRTEMVALSLASPPPPPPLAHATRSRVGVGRHGIRLRQWAHPDAEETMRAHWIIERVQREQRAQYGGSARSNQRPIIVVTPTYVRTCQMLHLTGLLHSLLLVPFPLTWVVVEAAAPATARPSNDTAEFLARSGLPFLRIPFPDPMPEDSRFRRLAESRMRLLALRVVRDRRMDGIVVFADDSNVHSPELFDEAQKVKWMSAVSMGILIHTGQSPADEAYNNNDSPVPIQGPACNSSGHLVGWHTYNPLPNTGAAFIGAGKTVSPAKMEWAGFVLNSRLLWKDVAGGGKPAWVRDLDDVGKDGEDVDSPLALLDDASFVEPLGNCGKKVLLWWLRAEARHDSNFPTGWRLKPVQKKHTSWIDAPPELPSQLVMARSQDSRNNMLLWPEST